MIDYSYTPTSKIDTITYPDTSTVRFTYNQHDDLTRMQDALGNTDYTYYADHSLNTVTDPNGFVVTYNKYDAAGIGGWVCLDSLKQFLSDKLLGLISLPAF